MQMAIQRNNIVLTPDQGTTIQYRLSRNHDRKQMEAMAGAHIIVGIIVGIPGIQCTTHGFWQRFQQT
jgi:predicted membrane GTPase involved in stress response